MSLETNTRTICLKRYSFINIFFSFISNNHQYACTSAARCIVATFSKQLLKYGNGKVPIDAVTNCISFPSNFCTAVPCTEQLIQSVFPKIAINYENHERLCERAILAEKNNDVNTINNIIQGQI